MQSTHDAIIKQELDETFSNDATVIDNAGAWRMAPDGSVLTAPNGRVLPLSPGESALLAGLLARNGRPVRREAAAAHVWPDPGRQSAAKARSVDVLVSRLRRKAQRLQIELPLMAVRRMGYVFMPELGAGGG